MTSRRDIFSQLVAQLADNQLYTRREAEAVARAALTGAEKISVSHFLAFADEECRIEPAEIKRITTELTSGRPLQYVLGRCEFCGMEFEVGEGVLIPRPETEELVAAVMERAGEGSHILDLCTGSGCIAIVLAKQLNNSHITAVDISPEALQYARRNARRNGVAVDFVEADIFEDGFVAADRQFDVIVSNPPYVPASDKASMHTNVVGFEPHEALFVPDDDQLRFYGRICRLGRKLLRDGGLLCCEIYEMNAEPLARMAKELNYNDISIIDDANLKPRILCCRK